MSSARQTIVPESSISQRTEIILVLLLLLITAVSRMGWPGLTEFKADEARLLQLALNMAEFDTFPLRGISSSVGFPNFPMSVWLYALPLFFWKSAISATLFTGFLNTLAVLGCYWLVRRYWGVEAALTSALLFAVSPWAIHHSRKIWAQNLLPVFVVGWAITAVLSFVESRSKWIIIHFLCLAIAAQTHLAAFALIPATGLIMLFFWRRINWKHTLLGIFAAGLTLVPFFIYLLTEGKGYVNIEAVSAGNSAIASSWSFDAIYHLWRLTSGWQIHALAGEAFADYLATVPSLTAVYWIWGTLFLAGLVVMVEHIWNLRSSRDKQGEVSVIFLIWLVIPILFFSTPFLPVEIHYLIPLYPVPYIIMGIFVAKLAPRWRWALLGLLLITAVLQLYIWGSLLQFVNEKNTPGGYGTPLATQLDMADAVRELYAATGASELLIAGVGDDPLLDAFPATTSVLLRDLPHRFVDVRNTAVFPQERSIILLDPTAAGLSATYQAVDDERISIPLKEGAGELLVLALPATAVPPPDHTFDPPPILTNWASFAGYDNPDFNSDGTALWRIYWNVGEASTIDYHLFNHLSNAHGERIAQVDMALFPTSQWQLGDVVISQSQLEWPNDATIMRSGMYQYPSLEPVLIFDVAGNPHTDAVEIELP